ncbi:MAG: hypothetical protein NUV77_01395, partial [Thermoguttaceae bacterium]|nr:hypothetical protein [Thermoguttaceae bacterium]
MAWSAGPRPSRPFRACHPTRLGSITKQGSAMVRFILGQWVRHVLQKDPAMKAWYQRIKKRRGSKIARVAVMRRLATVIWHMVKDHQPYQFGGLGGRPKTATPSAEPTSGEPETKKTARGASVPKPGGQEKTKRAANRASVQGFRRPR